MKNGLVSIPITLWEVLEDETSSSQCSKLRFKLMWKHICKEISPVAQSVTRAAISRTMTVNNKSLDNIRGEDYTVLSPHHAIRASCTGKLVKHLQTMFLAICYSKHLMTEEIRFKFIWACDMQRQVTNGRVEH